MTLFSESNFRARKILALFIFIQYIQLEYTTSDTKTTKQWIKNYNFDEIYEVFREMVKEGMECSPFQFCCEQ